MAKMTQNSPINERMARPAGNAARARAVTMPVTTLPESAFHARPKLALPRVEVKKPPPGSSTVVGKVTLKKQGVRIP